jgi:hypothetical protein
VDAQRRWAGLTTLATGTHLVAQCRRAGLTT